MSSKLLSQLSMTILTLGMGILIAAQLRTFSHARVGRLNEDDRAVLLSGLVEANFALRAEVESLRARQEAYLADGGSALEELVGELNRLKVINGSVEVSGPGVELWVDGPLSALDLQDLIHELRNAGAEAIALNGLRVAVNSVVTVDGRGQLMMDGKPLRRPFRLQAIGDPGTLETALLRPGGLLSLLRRSHPNLVVSTAQRTNMVLGVRLAQLEFQYARPVK